MGPLGLRWVFIAEIGLVCKPAFAMRGLHHHSEKHGLTNYLMMKHPWPRIGCCTYHYQSPDSVLTFALYTQSVLRQVIHKKCAMVPRRCTERAKTITVMVQVTTSQRRLEAFAVLMSEPTIQLADSCRPRWMSEVCGAAAAQLEVGSEGQRHSETYSKPSNCLWSISVSGLASLGGVRTGFSWVNSSSKLLVSVFDR